MPSSYGSTVAAAVFIFALTFSTSAHAAETAATTIHDPVTDTIQLWSGVLTSIESLANQLAAGFATPHKVLSTVSPNNQPASNTLTPTAFPAAAAVAASNLNTAPQPIHAGPTSPANAAGASDPSPHYVTQGALNAQLSALEKTIVSELQTIATALTAVAAQSQNGKPSPLSVPSASSEIQQQLDALQNEISQTNRINDLSNVTITSPSFSGVTTSNIPEGSNLYYTDARVTSLLAATAATTTFGGGIALSSGCVSVNGTCLGTGGGGGSGTVTSITAGTGLTGGTITTSGTIALNTANQNTWSALQLFAAGASSTAESVFNDAFFGATATSSFNSAGQLVLANLASAVLAVDNTGKVIATSSIGTNLLTGTLRVANGGTGWSAINSGTVLLGNGSGAFSTTTTGNLTETGSSILSITGGTNALLGSGTTIQVAQASGSQSGFLASGDWTTFNNKASTASPTFTGTATFANLTSTSLAQFANASSSLASVYAAFYVGTTATTTISGTATSTFGAGISVTYLNLTGSSATSTAANGINLSAGCFSINGTCVGESGDNSLQSQLGLAFTADTGQTITAGNLVSLAGDGDIQLGYGPAANVNGPVTLSLTTSSGAQTAVLSSTSFVVVYSDSTNSNKQTAIVCSLSGTATTCGAPVVVSNSTNGYVIAVLSSTSFAVYYSDSTNGNKQTAVVGSVSGTTITLGTPVVSSNSTNTSSFAIADLDSAHFVVEYIDSTNSNKQTAVVGSVSGTTITFGTAATSSNSTATNPISSIAALSSTSFVVEYTDSTDSGKQTAVVGSVSGTTITFGTPVVSSNSTNTNGTSLAVLGSSAFIVEYIDSNNSNKRTAVVGSVSGTTITFGTPVVWSNSTNTGSFPIADLDSTHFVVEYIDSTNGNKQTAVVGSVSGTTITFGTAVTSSNATNSTTSFFLADLDSTHFVVEYTDNNNDNRATVEEGVLSGTQLSFTGSQVYDNTQGQVSALGNVLAPNSLHFVAFTQGPNGLRAIAGTVNANNVGLGVAAGSASAGQSVNVIFQGIAGGFSGLATGTPYYANGDGTLTAISTGNRVGVAISNTQLLLNQNTDPTSNFDNQFFGDAVFANNFHITEAQNGPQGLIFVNQLGRYIASLDETGKLTVNSLNVTGLPTGAGTSVCLNADDDIVTNQSGCASFATTTVDELLSTSTTLSLSTSTPWIGAFGGASNSFQTELATLAGEVIRAFDQPIYAAVGIFNDMFAENGHFSNELCVGSTCVTPAQFQTMVAAAGISQGGGATDASASTTPTSSDTDATNTPPVIQINGDNPAYINVGAAFNDLGATITGPIADLNLGVTTYMNGIETNPVQIDTSAAATDTIDYVATGQNGLTSTSTRTVIIEASPSIVPTGDAPTTATTTTP